MFDVHLRILHAPNCRKLKESRKISYRVLGFHRLITSQHSTHTPRCSTLTPRFFASEFSGTIFPGTNFLKTISPGTNFPGTNFLKTIFPGTNLPGTIFPGNNFPGTIFPGTNFLGTIFPGDHFFGHHFSRDHFSREPFFGDYFSRDHFPGDHFSGTIFPRTLSTGSTDRFEIGRIGKIVPDLYSESVAMNGI